MEWRWCWSGDGAGVVMALESWSCDGADKCTTFMHLLKEAREEGYINIKTRRGIQPLHRD